MRLITWATQCMMSVFKLFFIIIFALFLPQLCIWQSGITYHQSVNIVQEANEAEPFLLGIENISDRLLTDLKNSGITVESPIALITNQTGTNQEGLNSVDILSQKGFLIEKVILPYFQRDEKKSVGQQKNKSLEHIYVPLKDNHEVLQEHFAAVDAIMFDLQDLGVRSGGYLGFLFTVLKVAAQLHKKVIIFDRPNPLGWCMEGFSCPFEHHGVALPMRHGMTVGELACYFNMHGLSNLAQITVVPMEQYVRYKENRDLLQTALSPNITSPESCYGYSFLGVLGEVAPLDVGVGTDKAFQCILLPERLKFSQQQWQKLRVKLREHGIESKPHRYFNSRKNLYYAGLRLYIKDINQFSAFATLCTLLKFFKSEGISLVCSPHFDTALGTYCVRAMLTGEKSWFEVAREVNEGLQAFFKKASSCFLYKPYPTVMQV